jgi:predicted MFS family arabinose efflux permease
MHKAISLKKPLLLWSLASIFFAFQFILRLSTGILREEIIQKFAIDTIAFGTVAGYYYLGYAGMQIPIGIMLDKFNFRIVTFISILATSLGTLTFVASENFNYLLIGRFMIGAGSAVGFLSVAKITRRGLLKEEIGMV